MIRERMHAKDEATVHPTDDVKYLSQFGRWLPLWLSWRCETANEARKNKEPPWQRIAEGMS